MPFLESTPAVVDDEFSVEALVDVIKVFVNYLFDKDNGPIKMLLDIITENQILWVFLGFAICTIGISLLKRIRGIF